MIELKNLIKTFNRSIVLNDISLQIDDSSVYGLIGSNGAGKSTMLRIMSGIFCGDSGGVFIDGLPVFENIAAKRQLFYISDDQLVFNNDTMDHTAAYYAAVYDGFSFENYARFADMFHLARNKSLGHFSKGMRKCSSVCYAFASGAKYIFMDETFDGLDPVNRELTKRLIAAETVSRQLTLVISSHNLRELEDICDHVCLLHNGNIRISSGLDDLVENLHRIRCVFSDEKKKEDFSGLDIVSFRGARRMCTLTVRGVRSEITAALELMDPVSVDIVPLSLEEIFVYEMEAIGYDAKKITF